MSALSRASAALALADRELDDATREVPTYARDAVRALRRDVRESLRRLGNTRAVLGDVDPPEAA